jgi:hypothetical protein
MLADGDVVLKNAIVKMPMYQFVDYLDIKLQKILAQIPKKGK